MGSIHWELFSNIVVTKAVVLKVLEKFRKTPRKTRDWTLFLKKRLQHRYFPENFVKFLRAHFLQSTSRGLLLLFWSSYIKLLKNIYKMFIFSKISSYVYCKIQLASLKATIFKNIFFTERPLKMLPKCFVSIIKRIWFGPLKSALGNRFSKSRT